MYRLLKGLALWLSLAASPLHATVTSNGSVTFINPGGTDGFWGNVSATMQESARQLNVKLEVLHSNRNRLLMLAHANDIATRAISPDAVIVVNELQQGSQLLQVLGSAGIPVYFLLNTVSREQIDDIARETGVTPTIIGSIVPENFKAGYEMLKRLVQDKPVNSSSNISVLAVLGDQLTPAALDREAGMRQAIAELDGVELERAFSVLWDPKVAFKRVSTAMSLIDFDVIWAANDALALAAHRAVLANCTDRQCKNIPIVGLNWSPEGLDGIASGALLSSHGGHFTAGGYAIAAISNHLAGYHIEANVTLLMKSVDLQNIDRIADLVRAKSWNKFDFRALSSSLVESQDRFDPMQLFSRRRQSLLSD